MLLDALSFALPVRPAPVEGRASLEKNCSNCATRHICMPSGLSQFEFAKLDAMLFTSRKIRRGEALYRVGDPFQQIHMIKAGSFKTVVGLRDGREQITGFQLIGEPLGVDGISTERHICNAVALEDSVVCTIPLQKLERVCQEIKGMQRHVYRWMSSEIARESALITLLGSMSADERVSSFLLDISQRLQTRGFSSTDFKLRMTREEIGNYLGLKLETVSRMLSRFQNENRINVHCRTIQILNVDRLRPQ